MNPEISDSIAPASDFQEKRPMELSNEGTISSFDLFTGSDTGFLKGCFLSNKSSTKINSVVEPKKELSITCLSWGKEDRSVICTGCKYGRVYSYCLKTASCMQLHEDQHSDNDNKKVLLRGMRVSETDINLIMAFNSGLVKLSKFENLFDEEEEKMPTSTSELDAGSDLFCMDQNVFSKSFIATGGKKNPVKIWDTNNLKGPPIFTAKNVKNDWLNLHVPIWVTSMQFASEGNKLLTGTGYSQIRMYDPSTPQKRPVLEMKYEENPITAIALRPGIDSQVVVGNTLGNIALLDLRKKAIVKGFKGSRGGITDIQFHPQCSVFATCGVDRFVNVYGVHDLDDKNKKKPLYSMYMHSSLSSLLFSSNWSPGSSTFAEEVSVGNFDITSKKDSDCEGVVEEEKDDVWDSMAVVKTKKRKSQSKDSVKSKRKK